MKPHGMESVTTLLYFEVFLIILADSVTAKKGTKYSLCDADIGGITCMYDEQNNRYICEQHQIWKK